MRSGNTRYSATCESVLLVRCQISRPSASHTGQFCQHCHCSRAKILVLDLGRGRVRYRSQRQRDGCHLASTAIGKHDRAGSKGKNALGRRAHGPAWVTSEALTACHPIRPAQIEAGMPGRLPGTRHCCPPRSRCRSLHPPWGRTRTVSRIDAGGFTAFGSPDSGRLRSVTGCARRGTGAVERLVERARRYLCAMCAFRLLIRGFGVQVPGGAPRPDLVLYPGRFSMLILHGARLRPSWGPSRARCHQFSRAHSGSAFLIGQPRSIQPGPA
jgi:hypothetical protein